MMRVGESSDGWLFAWDSGKCVLVDPSTLWLVRASSVHVGPGTSDRSPPQIKHARETSGNTRNLDHSGQTVLASGWDPNT